MTRTMYDSVTVAEIPADASAVAGYVGGRWPTFRTLERRFRHADRLSIAVNSAENAECLDIESGDATAQDAPAWVRRQHSRGVPRPVVYASQSAMPEVLAALEHAGVKRSEVRVWSAHYGLGAHICTPARCHAGFYADGTQWTDQALGRNLDESLILDTFFPPRARPHLHVAPEPKPARPRRPAKPRAKVTAAALAGAIATGVQALIHTHGVHITPAAAAGIAAAAAAIAGYLIPERTPSAR